MNMNNIGKRAHVLKHSHVRCVVGAFDKCFTWRLYLDWTNRCSILYLTQINISSLFTSRHKFYDIYIKCADRKIYIDDDGSGIFPEQKVRKLYSEKYQETYANRNYVISKYFIKYMITSQVYSGRKKMPQVLCIFKVYHIVMLKDNHSSYHVFMMQ